MLSKTNAIDLFGFIWMLFLLWQDAGVHALSNVFHVDVERISKRKPGELVSSELSKILLHLYLVFTLAKFIS